MVETDMGNGKRCCAVCRNCDGFACLWLDVWLDGKIRVGRGPKSASVKYRKELNYSPVTVYGRKYCRHFNRGFPRHLRKVAAT